MAISHATDDSIHECHMAGCANISVGMEPGAIVFYGDDGKRNKNVDNDL